MRAISRPRHPRRRMAALVAALGLVALLFSALGTATTEAAWTDGERAGSTFTAGQLGAPVANGCDVSGRTFTPYWTAPAAPSVRPTQYRYRVIWQSALAGDQVQQDWTFLPANTTQFSYAVPAGLLQLGTYRFEVEAYAGSWKSTVRTGSAVAVQLAGVPVVNSCSWS